MAAAASEGASSGDANDDAVPGRCCERRPRVGRVGRAGLATAPGELGGAVRGVPGWCCERRLRVSRVGRVGPDAWQGLQAAPGQGCECGERH